MRRKVQNFDGDSVGDGKAEASMNVKLREACHPLAVSPIFLVSQNANCSWRSWRSRPWQQSRTGASGSGWTLTVALEAGSGGSRTAAAMVSAATRRRAGRPVHIFILLPFLGSTGCNAFPVCCSAFGAKRDGGIKQPRRLYQKSQVSEACS